MGISRAHSNALQTLLRCCCHYHHTLFSIVCFSLFLLGARSATPQPATCDATTYGKPLSSDCGTLFQKFTESQVLQTRFFDEEQLRADDDFSWPGVNNTFGSTIVQLPKFYAMNTCNFALMPYTNPRTRLVQPLGITNWGSIKTAGKGLINECLNKGSSAGGETFVKDSSSADPALVIFMWASGAKFEAKLNHYEDDSTYSPQLSLAVLEGFNGTNGTLVGGGVVPSGILIRPVETALPQGGGGSSEVL